MCYWLIIILFLDHCHFAGSTKILTTIAPYPAANAQYVLWLLFWAGKVGRWSQASRNVRICFFLFFKQSYVFRLKNEFQNVSRTAWKRLAGRVVGKMKFISRWNSVISSFSLRPEASVPGVFQRERLNTVNANLQKKKNAKQRINITNDRYNKNTASGLLIEIHNYGVVHSG